MTGDVIRDGGVSQQAIAEDDSTIGCCGRGVRNWSGQEGQKCGTDSGKCSGNPASGSFCIKYDFSMRDILIKNCCGKGRALVTRYESAGVRGLGC